jgi:hypothetical protein
MAGSTQNFQQNEKITTNQAQTFLTNYLGVAPSPVTLLGEGAWSRCFGFCHKDEELVIRFGKYAADFGKDQLALGLTQLTQIECTQDRPNTTESHHG